MASVAALLAAAAAVQAAPRSAGQPAEASSQSKAAADPKAAAKKAEKKPADKAASAKKSTGKSSAKTSEKGADKKAAKRADKKAAKTKADKKASKAAAVPLPKRRPAESATTAGAFPTPIGVAPILSSSFVSAQPAVSPQPAAERAAPPPVVSLREAALTPPATQMPAALVPAIPIAPESLSGVKRAIEMTRRGRNSEATAVAGTVTDPVAAKLIEWVVLRAETDDFDFQRYAGFATENPGWPNINQFRRKAEAALFQNGVNDAVVRRYFATNKPLTAKGRLAYARALLSQGDRAQAQSLVREAWRMDALTADLERQVVDAFGSLLTGGDHKARMDRRLYAEDTDAALRAAQRLGPSQVAIVRAFGAVVDKSSKAKALLDAVPGDARGDTAYLFARAQLLRRADQVDEAAKAVLAASSPGSVHDPDEWWNERRLLARKLLDAGDAQTAFRVARDAAMPEKEGARVEHLFTAGWIAFRFLHQPATAKPLFAKAIEVAEHPASISRGHYWYARTCEALGQNGEARTHYERAARFSSTYYGQIAHARLGGAELRLPPPPQSHPQGHRLEIVRAMEMLYAIDERDLVASAAADMADRAVDPAALAAVAALAEKKSDARTLVLLGRTAVSRGLPFEYYAYPTAGLPKFNPIGPHVDPHVAYAIARQESGFNPKARSSANAQGLMQVLPATAKLVAKRNGIAFDAKKLYDPVYNVQIGAAELGHAIENYRGSYILTFVAYNAGPGRVRDWIERFGDPRDPKIDPIDWVERIPFSETRNYVQRVLENMQVYRVRFGASPKLMIEADLRRGMAAN